MKKLLYLFLFVVVFVSTCSKDEPMEPPINDMADPQQMEFIAKLTGEMEIEEGVMLSSRYWGADKAKVRTYLLALIGELSLTGIEHPYTDPTGEQGTNVYTTLPATNESEEYIVLGAHFDTVGDSPGASDNATGMAVVYSVVKKLADLDQRNKNVMLVFFDDEEIGLRGSREFAKKIKNEGLNVHSVHTVDQMGWDEDGDRAIELELPTDYLQQQYEDMAANFDIPVHVTSVGSTDHSAFRNEGFKAIGLTEEYVNGDTTPHIHQETDTYDTVNFEYLASSTDLMFRVIREMLAE